MYVRVQTNQVQRVRVGCGNDERA